MKTLGIIPARYASTRFPGKPLVEIDGQSMLQRVYNQACKASLLQQVVIATDDERIFTHAQAFGARVMYTDPGHQSGTDRCAEVAAAFPEVDVVVNIQGDEPFIDPAQIDAVIEPFPRHPDLSIATLAKLISDERQLFNPNVVKVVFDKNNMALYFSRHPIPYLRNIPQEFWLSKKYHFKHIGLYAFRNNVLQRLGQLPHGIYEQAESLEQLRWLEAGYRIFVGQTEVETVGIDTPEDLERLGK